MIRTYISADIETNGSTAGLHSMISLGCSAHNQEGKQIDKFEINVSPYSDLKEDPDTMQWWKRFPEQYEQSTKNPYDPSSAASGFLAWLSMLPGELILICHNAPFDHAFIKYWLIREGYKMPFFTAIDTRMLAWSTGKYESFNWIKKKDIAIHTQVSNPNGHNALADAEEQAEIFFKLIKELSLSL